MNGKRPIPPLYHVSAPHADGTFTIRECDAYLHDYKCASSHFHVVSTEAIADPEATQ